MVVRVQLNDRGHRTLARELRVRAQDAPGVVRDLNAKSEVAWADIAPEPAPLPASPNFTALQKYRLPAQGGLDATYANSLPGGRGENVRVADIEYNWNFAHEDLSTLRTAGARVSGTWICTWRSIEKSNASLLLASMGERRASRLWASLLARDQLRVRIDVGTTSAS